MMSEELCHVRFFANHQTGERFALASLLIPAADQVDFRQGVEAISYGLSHTFSEAQGVNYRQMLCWNDGPE